MKKSTKKKQRVLTDLTYLYLDCQTTGATPERGRVLEIGWAVSSNLKHDTIQPKTYVIKISSDEKISRRILSITGIPKDEIESGHSEKEVWMTLVETAKKVAKSNRMQQCLTVIHYKKFEAAFLHDLHQRYSPNRRFPFRIICTHEIARRLFPQLPRKGIRAIAGYLGHGVQECRRCFDHVTATAFIWERLLDALKKHNVTTLPELDKFISSVPPKKTTGRTYPMEDQVRRSMPDAPGVYRMLRSNGDVLYVGKATSLKQRVNSYFQKRSRHAEHILEMLSQAKMLDITETGSALEAALLETDEIKQLAPPYNKSLRQRGRQIVFFSEQLDDYAEKVSESHVIGPFTSPEPMGRLSLFGLCLRENDPTDIDTEVLSETLGVSEEYGPDEDCLIQGFDTFQKRYGDRLIIPRYYRELKRLGKELWIERQARLKLLEEEAEVEEVEEEEKTEFVWTPEAVARQFERNILWGMHEQRRAIWFVLLSESCIVWDDGGDQGEHIFIRFEKGQIKERGKLGKKDDGPDPPEKITHFRERQSHFDIATWDRMRVLNTEIRKLVSLDRWIRVRIGRLKPMGNSQLAKLFQWI